VADRLMDQDGGVDFPESFENSGFGEINFVNRNDFEGLSDAYLPKHPLVKALEENSQLRERMAENLANGFLLLELGESACTDTLSDYFLDAAQEVLEAFIFDCQEYEPGKAPLLTLEHEQLAPRVDRAIAVISKSGDTLPLNVLQGYERAARALLALTRATDCRADRLKACAFNQDCHALVRRMEHQA
jgi:hypothetical protein